MKRAKKKAAKRRAPITKQEGVLTNLLSTTASLLRRTSQLEATLRAVAGSPDGLSRADVEKVVFRHVDAIGELLARVEVLEKGAVKAAEERRGPVFLELLDERNKLEDDLRKAQMERDHYSKECARLSSELQRKRRWRIPLFPDA